MFSKWRIKEGLGHFSEERRNGSFHGASYQKQSNHTPCVLKNCNSSPNQVHHNSEKSLTGEKRFFFLTSTHPYLTHSEELLRKFSKPYILLIIYRDVKECPQGVTGREEEKQGD